MDKQLQQALAEFLNLTIDGLKSGATMVQNELPAVVREWLAWGLAENALIAVVAIAVIVASVKLHAWGCARIKDDRGDEPGFFAIMSSTVAGATACVFLIGSVRGAIQILIAPRVYLIESLLSLGK